MDYKSEIEELITKTSILTNKPLTLNKDFYVVHQKLKHQPLSLPKGKIAVYTFVCNDVFLKIGQADKNSKARYQSHHYYINSGNSTLANSLLKDPMLSTTVNKYNITAWIKTNCERFDVIIDAKYGKFALNYIEGLLHYQYNPKYEG